MKNPHPIIFILSLLCMTASAGDKKLFSFLENGKYGFINARGQVTIPAKFFATGDFSDGLASARQTGRYGYIDSTGSFVIEPVYDFAEPFSDGFAIVYIDGRPSVIDHSGKQQFVSPYGAISAFQAGRAVVSVGAHRMERYGVIDPSGRLIADTIYESIQLLDNGNMVLTKKDYFKAPRNYNNNSSALADHDGKLICPFGTYESMSPDGDNFSVIIPARPDDSIEGYSVRSGLADARGRLIYSKDHKNGFIEDSWSEGFAAISYDKPGNGGTYYGYIDTNGKVMKNHEYRVAHPFSCGRAFVLVTGFKFILIDRKGKKIGKVYDQVMGSAFYKGYALVSIDGKYGLIDTNGRFLVEPSFAMVSERVIDGRYFFFTTTAVRDKKTKPRYGVCTVGGQILVPELMTDYSYEGFSGGLLECVIDDKLSFIDTTGKIVWQNSSKILQPYASLNTEVMQRGHYYAYSLPIEGVHEHSGGWSKSENIPRRIDAGMHFETNKLSVSVRPDMLDTFAGTYVGLKTFISNTSTDTAWFSAQDSRLYMKVQALAPDGQWRDIEYLPSSWCGNSYHTLSLDPGYCWSFVTPQFEGDYKTKLRVELEYIDGPAEPVDSERRIAKLYSNEFDGSINPSQFWLKNSYTPKGIMDPYYD